MNYYDKFALCFLKDAANSLVKSIEYIQEAENEIANAKEDSKYFDYSIGSVKQRISPERAIQILNDNIIEHENSIIDMVAWFKRFEKEYEKLRYEKQLK